MFETLDSREQPVARRHPLLLYSTDTVIGLVFLVEAVPHPLGIVTGAVMFLLGVMWLITTIRSPGPVNRRDFWVRSMILFWVMMAYGLVCDVAGR